KWSGDDCNGGDNAAFSVRWRARLRRVQGFSMMQVLQQFLFNGFSDRITGAVRGAIDGAIGRWVPGGDVFRQTNFGVATIDMVAGEINSNVVEPLLEMAQGQLDRISESIMPTSIGGAYH